MGPLIHVAAPPLTFGTVRRQRCAWCGALIDEYDLASIAAPVERDAEGNIIPFEGPGAWVGLVAVDGGHRWAVDDPADGRAPESSCMERLPVDPA